MFFARDESLMMTGRSFRLRTPTLGIGIDSTDGGKRVAVPVPADAVVKVVAGPSGAGDRMVDVLWDGQVLVVFVIDLTQRGEEITGRAST
jgi:hypothetical protein